MNQNLARENPLDAIHSRPVIVACVDGVFPVFLPAGLDGGMQRQWHKRQRQSPIIGASAFRRHRVRAR